MCVKQKIGTLIEQETIRLAKRRAAEEGRPLSDLIQEALVQYLSAGRTSDRQRELAYHLFCEQPIKLSRDQFQQVLDEDSWDS